MARMNLRVGAVLLVAAASLAPGVLAGDAPEAVRQGQLVSLVRQDCGSCHGMTLKGGLGPPLTREALRDKPSASLVTTLLHGRPGTAMPPWREFVSGVEAEWIVRQLQEGTLRER